MVYEILSLPRCGSTYLQSIMSFYLEDKFDSYIFLEPFNEDTTHHHPDIGGNITKLESIADSLTEHVVVKNHFNHYARLYNKEPILLYRFLNLRKNRIILFRKDHFATIVSELYSNATKIWSIKSEEKDKIKPVIITGSKKLFIDRANNYFYCLEKLKQLIAPNDKVVYYEDLEFWPRKDWYNLGYTDKTIQELPKFKLMTEPSFPKEEVITNYSELKDIYLTSFAKYSI
jgi:hypothetical protein